MAEMYPELSEQDLIEIKKSFCLADGYSQQSLETAVTAITKLLREVRCHKYWAEKYQQDNASLLRELEALRGK